jgi:hypothetical protein
VSRGSAARRVRFLPEKQIEREAQLLLDEWAAQGHEVGIPVPLECILESHLQLGFELEDLRARFGGHDVLGAIWFADRVVRIDSSLDPVEHPAMLGRYNFTIAHEMGHWRLHRDQLLNDPNEAMLFEAGGGPAFVCRDGDRAPEEWQADNFASCLLMPRELVRSAWRDWRGTDDPVAVADLDVGDFHGDREKDEQMAKERFCREFADIFEVSAQAMRIRLEKLELLVQEIEPGLF